MLVTVLPMRIVVRNLLMSLRISVNGESGPSWSLISRTFHGQRVVMAVSLVQKNAYATSSATVPTMDPVAADQSTVIFVAASTAAAATSFLAPAALAALGANMNHATHAATPAARRATSASGPLRFRSGASSDADVRGNREDAEGWYAAGDGEEAEDDDTRTRRGRTGTE